jgi:hypothetical protein
MVDKMVSVLYKSNKKDKEFEYNFLKLYRYLNIITDVYFIANKNNQKSLQHLNLIQSTRKIYFILVEHCMKLTLLSGLDENNYYKIVKRAYNFRIQSKTG